MAVRDKFRSMRERKPCGEYDPNSINWKGDIVVIERDIEPEAKNGIIVPDSARKPTLTGKIVALGDKLADDFKELQVGMRVDAHGFAMIPIRFSWEGKIYDVLASEEIELIRQEG